MPETLSPFLFRNEYHSGNVGNEDEKFINIRRVGNLISPVHVCLLHTRLTLEVYQNRKSNYIVYRVANNSQFPQ